MGNYTQYELEVEDRLVENRDVEFDTEQAIKKLKETCDEADYALDENGDTQGPCKWYDHEDDLKKFSLAPEYEDVLFTLSGAGEESKDIWKLYVMNGKAQLAKAKITFDNFDEKLLK